MSVWDRRKQISYGNIRFSRQVNLNDLTPECDAGFFRKKFHGGQALCFQN